MADQEQAASSWRKKIPGWKLAPETELVRRNYEESLRGVPRPLVPPIFASSTYVLENAKEGEELSSNEGATGYLYSRWGNPTVDAAADTIARLEGATGSLLFSSGMAAIVTSMLTFLQTGDHIVICQPCYGGVNKFVRLYLQKMGVELTWVKGSSIEQYKQAVKSNTKVLYGETPANPTMSILDLEAFSELGKSLPGVISMVDCTFASPFLIQPIKYGVDVSIHSWTPGLCSKCSATELRKLDNPHNPLYVLHSTKYLAGHTDLVGGAVSYGNQELGSKLHEMQLLLGNNMSPFDAFLLHRSLKTLALRMERHSENAMAVAKFLEAHPKVQHVHYPGLPSHPDHKIAKKQMKHFSGMVSFELHGGLEKGIKLAESTQVAVLAVSLGGVETLVEHPASMTHNDRCVPPEMKNASGITDGLLRLSVGIEHVKDLIQDLEQALDKI